MHPVTCTAEGTCARNTAASTTAPIGVNSSSAELTSTRIQGLPVGDAVRINIEKLTCRNALSESEIKQPLVQQTAFAQFDV
jgi:hypothetical protein